MCLAHSNLIGSHVITKCSTFHTSSFGISYLKGNGSIITDRLSKAEIINSQFNYVFTPYSEKKYPPVAEYSIP